LNHAPLSHFFVSWRQPKWLAAHKRGTDISSVVAGMVDGHCTSLRLSIDISHISILSRCQRPVPPPVSRWRYTLIRISNDSGYIELAAPPLYLFRIPTDIDTSIAHVFTRTSVHRKRQSNNTETKWNNRH
jgi:hypothetical protein